MTSTYVIQILCKGQWKAMDTLSAHTQDGPRELSSILKALQAYRDCFPDDTFQLVKCEVLVC